MLWLLLTLAIAPGAFWMWYFRRRDHLRPEPRHLVGRVFAYGAVAALGAGAIEAGIFAVADLEISEPFVPASLLTAGIVGVVEEAVKFTALFLAIYRHVHFDEVIDGILYGVAASLGFATVENVAYVLQGGTQVGILRASLSVPGHAFFGAVMPTVVEGRETVVKDKPVRVDLKAADGEVVVSRVEAGGTGAPTDQA